MIFMISLINNYYQNHRRKVTTMTNNTIIHPADMNSGQLMKLRREKRAERRRRQMNAFYENLAAQNADKIIFLFDNDLNIA